MSSRPQFDPYPVIKNGDMSQASLTSDITIIRKLSLLSYGVSWSGTSPVGSIVVEVSNDYAINSDGSVQHAGTWNDLPLSAPTTVSGNTGMGFIDIFATSAFAIRLKYIKGSGTGTLQVTACGKVA